MASTDQLAALSAVITAEPYASMSDAAVLSALKTNTVQGRRVPFGDIIEALVDDDCLVAIQVAAADTNHAYHAACAKALASLEAANRYGASGALFTSGSAHLAMMNAMVDEAGDTGPLKKATRDAIVAKGLRTVAEAEGLSWVRPADILEVRA